MMMIIVDQKKNFDKKKEPNESDDWTMYAQMTKDSNFWLILQLIHYDISVL